LFQIEGVDVPDPPRPVELDPLDEPVLVVVVGVRRAVKFHPVQELLAEVEDGDLRHRLAFGAVPPLAQEVEQGVFGGLTVLSAFGELAAGAADVTAPPATVKEGFGTARHGRFLQEETFGESVSRGGGCVLIGVGPAVPLATLTLPPLPRRVQGKSGNEKWQGAKTGGIQRARLTATSCAGEPCECRGDWIRTSDLLNPIQRGEAKKGRISRVFRGIGVSTLPTF